MEEDYIRKNNTHSGERYANTWKRDAYKGRYTWRGCRDWRRCTLLIEGTYTRSDHTEYAIYIITKGTPHEGDLHT